MRRKIDKFKHIVFFIIRRASNESSTEEAAIATIEEEVDAQVSGAKELERAAKESLPLQSLCLAVPYEELLMGGVRGPYLARLEVLAVVNLCEIPAALSGAIYLCILCAGRIKTLNPSMQKVAPTFCVELVKCRPVKILCLQLFAEETAQDMKEMARRCWRVCPSWRMSTWPHRAACRTTSLSNPVMTATCTSPLRIWTVLFSGKPSCSAGCMVADGETNAEVD